MVTNEELLKTFDKLKSFTAVGKAHGLSESTVRGRISAQVHQKYNIKPGRGAVSLKATPERKLAHRNSMGFLSNPDPGTLDYLYKRLNQLEASVRHLSGRLSQLECSTKSGGLPMIYLLKDNSECKIIGREGKYYLLEGGQRVKTSEVFSDNIALAKCKRKQHYTKRQAWGKCLDILRTSNIYVSSFKCSICGHYHVGKPTSKDVQGIEIGQFTYVYGRGRSLTSTVVVLPNNIPISTLGYP